MNKVIVCGNLGQDPEFKSLDTGTCIANLTVATSEVSKDKDGQRRENTEWHRVVVWGKAAEYVNSKAKQRRVPKY